jgi:glutamate 5-kinase
MPEATAEGSGSERALVRAARRIVVKVGSRLLQDSPAGRPAAIADELAALRRDRSIEALVVSSGAITLGVRALGLARRPTDMPTLQAVAAVGQRQLLQHWEHAFAAHRILIGQVLLTHDDLGNRTRFLNARHTLRALLAAGVVPIINENDTVAVEEIKFGDNDLLAALVCNLVSADVLLVLTDVDGLHDGSAPAPGRRIPVVRDIDSEAVPVAGRTIGDGVGSGGMASKVQAARMTAKSGIPTVVARGQDPSVIARVLDGEDVGTLFLPSDSHMTSRKHWIAYGSRPAGRITVDGGARRALVELGRSLLPAGVTGVTGDFDVGALVSVVDESGTEFARGLVSYGADELGRIKGLQSADIEPTLGYKYVDEAIHRDDLVIL